MQVRNWMTEQVDVAHPEDDIVAVRVRMSRRRVRQFPVVAAGKLVGIVTERDVRRADDPAAKVGAIMTRDVVTTTPATPIEDAAALLWSCKVSALPVVERGALVGIISESDLLQALIELTNIVDPTSLIEFDCEDGMHGAQRARSVLEGHGAQVVWMRTAAHPDGRLRVSLRVRASAGHAPEQVLTEAGFVVRAHLGRRAPVAVPLSESQPMGGCD